MEDSKDLIREEALQQSDHIADGGKKDDHLRDVTIKVDVISRQAAKLKEARIIWEDGDSCYEFHDKCVDCLDDVPPSQSKQRWILCEERLPEDGVEVLVYLFETMDPYIAWVENCRWYTEDFEVEKENYPTAWMPLPTPYRKEGENDA